MKKILLLPIILLLVLKGYSQLNNSWIDHSKTYYKFQLAHDTLCRINLTQLTAVGLQGTPVENFQLWRNGQQVRLYTSVTTGPLGVSDYIEFWGEMNDGKPDKYLYRDTLAQMCDRYSLETDTVSYFLTVNAATPNLRYTQSANPVIGTLLTPDAYFMRRIEEHYKKQINRGEAKPIEEYVYSSAYDPGEGWTSDEVFTGYSLSKDFTNINKYAAGPPNSVTFTIAASGNALYSRELVARFYNTKVLEAGMPYFNYRKDTIRNIPLANMLSNTNLVVTATGNSTNTNDRIVVACMTVTYPATFNFNNEKNFYFELAPNPLGNYLIINNFNNNGIAPILYDYTNGRRYLGNIDVAGQVRFVLPPSSDPVRKFNLISSDASNTYTVGAMTSKTFVNYADVANQGDYLIITNPVLFNNGSGVNNVDLYRQYRSSNEGGNFKVKVYDINELTEQFGFGIKKNPTAVRDFILYAKAHFNNPKYVFIIGHGLSYQDYTLHQSEDVANKLNLVQTYGWPVSDQLLASERGKVVPEIPIGRLGAVNGNEVGIYLDKVKEYEEVQRSPVQTIAAKGWMKNFLHTIGGSDSSETADFTGLVNGYKRIAEDTFYGANVATFAKSSIAAIEQTQTQSINNLFHEGVAYIKYFGHSSANELAINLNFPESYDNVGKYPFMHVSGCTVGNFFTYTPSRAGGLYNNMSLSEKYLFLPHKGAVGFLGSTHFGIAPFLDFYNNNLYHDFSTDMYGNTIGNQMKQTIEILGGADPDLDFYMRMHLEELTLHADPALRLSVYPKPDYVIEDQLVKFTPNIISVADNQFTIDMKMMNIGKAINDSIRVTVKQKRPDNSIVQIFDSKIKAMYYADSLRFTVAIQPITDKGRNELIIMLDDGDKIGEMSETNNYLVKEFYIFEDELRPISPYNFSIVNQQNINYYGSTANPLSSQRQYVMEIDTTELFNSSFKKSYTVTGVGGVIQFNPTNVTFTDSTVYYWRTATVPVGTGNYIWNNSSFIYLPSAGPGFNQSHYFQHLKNTYVNMQLDPDRAYHYDPMPHNIIITNGTWPISARVAQDITTSIDGFNFQTNYSSWYQTYRPFLNVNIYTNGLASPILNNHLPYYDLANTYNYDQFTQYNFEFYHDTKAERQKMIDFLDSIPNGTYVSIKNVGWHPYTNQMNIEDWIADGPAGQTLYDKLKGLGFSKIDSFYKERAWIFFYQKGASISQFVPDQKVAIDSAEKITMNYTFTGVNYNAKIISPRYGPVAKWTSLHWKGKSLDADTTKDFRVVEVYGIKQDGTSDLLTTVTNALDTTLSFIDKDVYPYIQLAMPNVDSIYATPNQLKYWRINADFIPEGAVAPNILYAMKDTVDQGENINFKVAFKNISPTAFDSLMKINLVIYDNNNQQHPAVIAKGKKLIAGDTLTISYEIETKGLVGKNTLFVDVNPANDQPEQYHFNNVLYKEFFVKGDVYNPLLDVTFDGVHILNKDIVAGKPHILIDLKDESRFLALADTSLMRVQVRFPDGNLYDYHFDNNMIFTPANLATGNNTAKIDFNPTFTEDGEYELVVSGKDVVGNTAGALNYHVTFNVISKAMISNLLNYPNPFTTSTAFVFTVTGVEVPQNIRIQILTITGKIVREITKDELGPIHIGNNITEFKWDGTDTYGQKLANGVYLYRVLTNLNGKSLERYNGRSSRPDVNGQPSVVTEGVSGIDKYFNKGYGKMVLIR